MMHPTRQGMSPEQVRPDMRVRVMEHHMVEQRPDLLLVGTVIGYSGRAIWRRPPPLGLGGASCSAGDPRVNSALLFSGARGRNCLEKRAG